MYISLFSSFLKFFEKLLRCHKVCECLVVQEYFLIEINIFSEVESGAGEEGEKIKDNEVVMDENMQAIGQSLIVIISNHFPAPDCQFFKKWVYVQFSVQNSGMEFPCAVQCPKLFASIFSKASSLDEFLRVKE